MSSDKACFRVLAPEHLGGMDETNMRADAPDRIWPYLLMAAGVLLLSLIVPRYWRWQESNYPIAASLQDYGHGTRHARADRANAHDSGPSLSDGNAPLELNPPRLARDEVRPHVVEGNDGALLPNRIDLSPAGFRKRKSTSSRTPHLPEPAEHAGWAFSPLDEFAADEWSAPLAPPLIVPLGPLVGSRVSTSEDSSIDQGEILPPSAPDPLNESGGGDKATQIPLPRPTSNHSAPPASNQQASTVWPRMEFLRQQLTAIHGHAAAEDWAKNVDHHLQRLSSTAIESHESAETLNELNSLCRQIDKFLLQIPDLQLLRDVRTAASAVGRRVGVWQPLQEIAAAGQTEHPVSFVDTHELRQKTIAATVAIPGSKAPPAWRRYLRLDEIIGAIDNGQLDQQLADELARNTLERMHSPRLDPRQRKLLSSPSMKDLARLLKQCATLPVDPLEVIYAVEQFELQQSERDAHRLSDCCARLRWSTKPAVARLAHRLEETYRGPNVRVAMTAAYLNGLLPTAETKTEDVEEQILSSYVAGKRKTQTRLRVQLMPHPNVWRLGLVAVGHSKSSTAGYADRATFFTQSTGEFTARKLYVVDHHQVKVWPAKAEATNETELVGVQTTFDGMPLLEAVARNTALRQYSENQWAAQQEIQQKMRQRATQLLDEQAQEPLFETQSRLRRSLLEPLSRLSVPPTVVGMQTTKERMIGRYRLAGLHHLGGHTPRPWAPADSVLSLQVHESAINNVIAGLGLNGRHDHLHTLYRDVYAMFGVKDTAIPDDMPRDVMIHFAEEEPVRVRFDEGQIELILRLTELRSERRVWRNLVIRNFYVPDPTSPDGRLVRENRAGLKGSRLRLGDQIALRGIISKVFGQSGTLSLLPQDLSDASQLKNVGVTQYVVQDGWIGFALGSRPALSGTREDTATPRAAARQR